MIWPFKRKRQPCFPVGPYRLNGSVAGLPGLIDFSAAELLALNSHVQFRGEGILHAPSIDFLERSWDPFLAARGASLDS